MDKNKLLEELKKIIDRQKEVHSDKEADHGNADDLLLEYINDPDIKELYEKIEKWYA